MARAAELALWAQKNARWILIVSVVVVVAALAFWYFRSQQAARAERAAAAFLPVGQAAAVGGPEARTTLEEYIRRYDGTREADEARVLLGALHLRENQPRLALPPLREVAGDRGPFSFQARMLLGAALGRDGQTDPAVQSYLEAAESAPLDYQRNEALNEAAVLRESAGDWRGAAELYRRMLEDVEEGSMDQSILQMRLTEAESRAAAGTAAAPPAAAGGGR